ncbi:serine/threonine protein phosphatase [Candidatus Babeliales bacterium]|nr:serine/threonine protein phosphatase [Candidatus Babeliales bacterium]
MKRNNVIALISLAALLQATPLNAAAGPLFQLQQGLTALKSKLAQLGEALNDITNPPVVPPITPAEITKLDAIQTALATKITAAATAPATSKTPETIITEARTRFENFVTQAIQKFNAATTADPDLSKNNPQEFQDLEYYAELNPTSMRQYTAQYIDPNKLNNKELSDLKTDLEAADKALKALAAGTPYSTNAFWDAITSPRTKTDIEGDYELPDDVKNFLTRVTNTLNSKIIPKTELPRYVAKNLAFLAILYLERGGLEGTAVDTFVQLPAEYQSLDQATQEQIAQDAWSLLMAQEHDMIAQCLTLSNHASGSTQTFLQARIRTLINAASSGATGKATPEEIRAFYKHTLSAYNKPTTTKLETFYASVPPIYSAGFLYIFAKNKDKLERILKDQDANTQNRLKNLFDDINFNFEIHQFVSKKPDSSVWAKIKPATSTGTPSTQPGPKTTGTTTHLPPALSIKLSGGKAKYADIQNLDINTLHASIKELKNILSLLKKENHKRSKPALETKITNLKTKIAALESAEKAAQALKDSANAGQLLAQQQQEATDLAELDGIITTIKSTEFLPTDPTRFYTLLNQYMATRGMAFFQAMSKKIIDQIPNDSTINSFPTIKTNKTEIARLEQSTDNIIKKINANDLSTITLTQKEKEDLNNISLYQCLLEDFNNETSKKMQAIKIKGLLGQPTLFNYFPLKLQKIITTLAPAGSSGSSGTGGSTSTPAFDPSTLPARKDPKVATAKTLTDWTTRCFSALPEYNCSSEQDAHTATDLRDVYRTALTDDQFVKIMKKFVTKSKTTLQHADAEWVNGATEKPHDDFFDLNKTMNEFDLAYIQKLVIPADNKVCFMGDYHGSVHSLLRNLWRLVLQGYLKDDFKLTDKFHLIFLGDFVDRGRYGAEVWYTLMKLKLANWDHVHLLRGNHETEDISKRYGFLGWANSKERGEVYNKFTAEEVDISRQILRLYNYLPFALFLSADGNEFVQCCHAGIALNDTGSFFNVTNFLTQPWPGITFQKISKKQTGFQWSDFSQTGGLVTGARGVADAVTADIEQANNYLITNNLKAFFRGHQDQVFGFKMLFPAGTPVDPTIPVSTYPDGPFHWRHVVSQADQDQATGFKVSNYQPVFTFTSASEGQAVPFDCFGIVTFGDGKYENWKLKIYEKTLKPDRTMQFVKIERSAKNSRGLAVSWHKQPLTPFIADDLVNQAKDLGYGGPSPRPLPKKPPATSTGKPSSGGAPSGSSSSTPPPSSSGPVAHIDTDLKKSYDEANNLIKTKATPFKIRDNFVKKINTIRASDTTTTLDILLGLDKATIKEELQKMVAFLTTKNSNKAYNATIATLTKEIDKLNP